MAKIIAYRLRQIDKYGVTAYLIYPFTTLQCTQHHRSKMPHLYYFTAIIALTLSTLAFGYTVDPPTTAPSNTIQDCTNWVVAASSDTCSTLAADGAITLSQLYSYVCLPRVDAIIYPAFRRRQPRDDAGVCSNVLLIHDCRIHLFPQLVARS
jgi:hypothetical protein